MLAITSNLMTLIMSLYNGVKGHDKKKEDQIKRKTLMAYL